LPQTGDGATRHGTTTYQYQGPIDAAALFRDHASFVASFLLRLGFGREDARDLTQEVFLVAHRRGGYVPGPARPTTWLAEIALRLASRKRRGWRRRPESRADALLTEAPSTSPSPADAAETTEDLARVQRALDSMALDRRAVFILFELEGESCDAIAAGLGIPLRTVYSRLHTARREFSEVYRRLLAAESRSTPTALQRVHYEPRSRPSP
jgi:RNA polymerase sigma-70 factor (ECF subfamily)